MSCFSSSLPASWHLPRLDLLNPDTDCTRKRKSTGFEYCQVETISALNLSLGFPLICCDSLSWCFVGVRDKCIFHCSSGSKEWLKAITRVLHKCSSAPRASNGQWIIYNSQDMSWCQGREGLVSTLAHKQAQSYTHTYTLTHCLLRGSVCQTATGYSDSSW